MATALSGLLAQSTLFSLFTAERESEYVFLLLVATATRAMNPLRVCVCECVSVCVFYYEGVWVPISSSLADCVPDCSLY